MSLSGLGKILDESLVKITERNGAVKKLGETVLKSSEKEVVAKKGAELEKDGLEKIGSKFTDKAAEETLKLSKDALSKNKLSNAVKLSFVDDASEVTTKLTENTGKRAPLDAIKSANSKYAEKSPELVALKYKNMSESPFAFYRATNYVFYGDVATNKALATDIKIPTLGDLHLENIGTYKTAQGKIAIGLNDFDDAITSPYTWELARCATSIRLAAKENGIGQKESKELVDGFIKDYLKDLKKFQEHPEKLSEPLTDSKDFGKHVEKTMEKAGEGSQQDFLKDMVQDGKFKLNDTVKPISDKTKKDIAEAIKAYAKGRNESPDFYNIKDSAFRIAGKGSLGRERYIVLLEGKTKSKADDIILELKEATQPAATNVLGNTQGNQAERVIKAANYFTPSPSPYLGVTKIKNTDFFVRELSSANQKLDLSKLNKPSEMKDYLEAVSEIVARAHAKSGKVQQILDDAGKKSDFSERIGDFADDYLKRVEKDYKKFVEHQ